TSRPTSRNGGGWRRTRATRTSSATRSSPSCGAKASPMTSLSRLGNARAVREPLLVTLPPSPAPPGAPLLRRRLRDRPGSLAAITRHLAEHGVNVLRLEVLGREGGWAVDDFLVSGAGLPAALAELEPEITVLANRPNVDLIDPGLAMANACA